MYEFGGSKSFLFRDLGGLAPPSPYVEPPLISHKTQNVNAKHLRCQCIVSGRSCEPSPHIFDIYLSLFSGSQFEKLALKT